jgi:hypothetical protein
MAFQIARLYDFITKLRRQEAQVIQNHDNARVPILDKAKPDTEIIKCLNLTADRRTTIQVTKLPL